MFFLFITHIVKSINFFSSFTCCRLFIPVDTDYHLTCVAVLVFRVPKIIIIGSFLTELFKKKNNSVAFNGGHGVCLGRSLCVEGCVSIIIMML